MKQILYILVSALLLSGIYTSCKKDPLEALHENEVRLRDQYVKDHNLADSLDVSGIYFKTLKLSDDTTRIRSKFKVMLQFNTFLIDDTTKVEALSTEDESGYTFDEYPFYVDVANSSSNPVSPQLIAGLHLGLKKMHVGDRAFLIIPSELAFKAVDYSVYGVPHFSTLLVYVYAKKGYPYGTY